MIIKNGTSDMKTLIENTIIHAEVLSDEGIAITNLKTDDENGDKLLIMAVISEYMIYLQYWRKSDNETIDLAAFRYDFWSISWLTDVMTDIRNKMFTD